MRNLWLIILLLLPFEGFADPGKPTVTGTFSSGSTVSISGVSFGTKAQAQPVVWDNFDSGTDGAYLRDSSPTLENMPDPYSCNNSSTCNGDFVWHDFPRGSETYRPQYTNIGQRTNSALSFRAYHAYATADSNQSIEIVMPIANTGDKVFFSFWWKMDRTSATWGRNVKPWQEYGSSSDAPMAYIGFGNPDYSDGDVRDNMIDGGTTVGGAGYGATNIADIEGGWVRIEEYLVQSAPSSANGICSHTILTADAAPDINEDLTCTTRTTSNTWRQWMFGEYYSCSDPTSATGYIYLDDLYFDTTPARVEICSEPTWGGRRHCEVQIPSSWSDDAITIDVNTGSFQPNDTVYLYVIDSNNVASPASDPIIIGASGGGTPSPGHRGGGSFVGAGSFR